MRNNSNSLIAFVAGLAVGAGIALFLQSEKGKELRQHVADFLEEKGIKLNKQEFDNLVASVARRFHKTSSPIAELEE